VSRETVSACLIATDEAARLPAALRSVAFCDEVIVVDGGSRDGTVDAARSAGATVVENPWPGFGAQRNVAIDHASGDWILEIDADERVTAELRAAILRVLEEPPEARLCGVPIREQYLGRRLGPAAKYPNYRLRLFRRGAYRHDESRTVHEGLVPDGPVQPLEGDLEHLLAESWGEALRDVRTYARLQAAQSPRRPGLRALALRPATKLAYRLVVDGGWRDGWHGAVRIVLDCASDVLVVARSGDPHDAVRRAPGAPRRIVAAASARDHVRALAWLNAARATGADVALVSDTPVPGDVRTRVVPRLGPLHVIRALTAESQLGGIDRVVAGPRVGRLVPERLRGGAPVLPLYEPASSERTTVV
jgi:Glycosyl transferase family 2